VGSNASSGNDRTAIIVGILLILLAGILFYDAVNLGRTAAYGIGPAMMPKVIAAGLGILGLLSIISGIRFADPRPEPFDHKAVLIIVGGFIALTVIIGLGGGFIPAMTLLFAVTAYAFGRRAVLVDLAIGLVLSLLIYLLFSKLLALSLPQGPLERLFG
jgi:putative tricarboxylic transport membrane protein